MAGVCGVARYRSGTAAVCGHQWRGSQMSDSVQGQVSSGVDARNTKSETTAKPNESKPCNERGEKVRAILKARLGEDIYSSWFNALEFESFDGGLVVATVPVKFLKGWIH